MNYFLLQAILIVGVGDEESTFWINILVFLLLAASWGVYSLVKNQQNEYKDKQRFAGETSTHHAKGLWRFRLPRKHIALCKDIALKYIAKTQEMLLHTRNLRQEPILDFDRPEAARQEKPENKLASENNKDLHSGMELLELDFLLSIIENTEGNDPNDVAMRKLNFNEIVRRKKLNQVNSKVLKVYATNRGNLYGKDIQCEAMRQLAERTSHKSKHNLLQPALPLSL